ncbi:MAG: histidine kinase [Oscillospiraceae bacterium]|nr:histidine kinase [Oscillospiraceae bacterium]
MKKILRNYSDSAKIVIIATIVALSSQFYINVFADSFRISFAVIILSFLLLTLGVNISNVKICSVTALFVFIFRVCVHAAMHDNLHGIANYIPNAVFYVVFGILFSILCTNKHTIKPSQIFITAFICDFLSNICEICITNSSLSFETANDVIVTLAAIAAVRAAAAWLLIITEKQYRTLLQREEHENRYQRLFLMTTGLKNEIFFMKKNSEEIENVMGTAYKLYEKLSSTDLDPEIKNMSLALAKDVHEIKKDYIRIIKGIENEISEEYDEKQMKFSDILHILKNSTYNLLEEKDLKINLRFEYKDNFVTHEHYELMNIFKNLVTNAIEAIEKDEKGDTITIEQALVDDEYIFVVKDNGPGISKRHLPNIFKMGYSTKFDYVTGNIYRGVGLCGVKATVEEEFGGSISVSSVFGDGTQFTIKIPAEAISLKQD